MRNTDHFTRHLFVEVWVDNEKVHEQGIHDPFVNTNTEIVTEFSVWDRIKLLFTGRHTTKARFHIRGDVVAHKRWFAGQDACDRCGATISGPGQHPDEPGYHHGNERICERCYYGHPQETATQVCAGTFAL